LLKIREIARERSLVEVKPQTILLRLALYGVTHQCERYVSVEISGHFNRVIFPLKGLLR
jgi:hypothetical protein